MKRFARFLTARAESRPAPGRRLQVVALGIACFALAGYIGAGSPGLKTGTPAVAAPAQDGAGQLAYEIIGGGTASIAGLQLPLVSVAGTGIGRATFTEGNLPAVSGPATFSADLDISQNPVAIRNGIVRIDTPSGEVLVASFEGQGTAPDARGFSEVTATFRITQGTSLYKSGAGTLTGLTNLFKSSFVVVMKGAVERTPPTP